MEFLHESDHAKFHFRTIDEIVRKAGELGLTIPVSENLEVLGEPVKLSWAEIPNSLGIHAMEGCDGSSRRRSRRADVQKIPQVCIWRSRPPLGRGYCGR